MVSIQQDSPTTTSTGENAEATPPNRHTKRRLESRAKVYNAAVELFIRQGYENTTMDQIADTADVARATVFNHFPKKTAFLDDWTAQRRQAGLSSVRRELREGWTLDDALYTYMTNMARTSVARKSETLSLLGATLSQTNFLANPALADELEDLMTEAQTSNASPEIHHKKQAALIIATGYFAVLSRWVAHPTPAEDLEADLHSMLDVVLHGLYHA